MHHSISGTAPIMAVPGKSCGPLTQGRPLARIPIGNDIRKDELPNVSIKL